MMRDPNQVGSWVSIEDQNELRVLRQFYEETRTLIQSGKTVDRFAFTLDTESVLKFMAEWGFSNDSKE